MDYLRYNYSSTNQIVDRGATGIAHGLATTYLGGSYMDHSTPSFVFPQLPARTSGVYCIQNSINGKRYIGSSFDMLRRLIWHVGLLDRSAHPNRHLQSAWNKYGRDAFRCAVLEATEPDQRLTREQFYIDTTQPEYNQTNVATGGPGVVGDATRQKHSVNSRARWADPEYKQRLSDKFIEINAQPEVKQRKAEAGKKRMSSPEARHAASERAKQQWADPEHRQRISEANKGTPPSDAARAAVAKANSQRVWTEEARQRQSEASKRSWERRRNA